MFLLRYLNLLTHSREHQIVDLTPQLKATTLRVYSPKKQQSLEAL